MKMMNESGSIIANGPAQKKNIDKVGRVLNSLYRVPVSFRLLVGPLIKFFCPGNRVLGSNLAYTNKSIGILI